MTTLGRVGELFQMQELSMDNSNSGSSGRVLPISRRLPRYQLHQHLQPQRLFGDVELYSPRQHHQQRRAGRTRRLNQLAAVSIVDMSAEFDFDANLVLSSRQVDGNQTDRSITHNPPRRGKPEVSGGTERVKVKERVKEPFSGEGVSASDDAVMQNNKVKVIGVTELASLRRKSKEYGVGKKIKSTTIEVGESGNNAKVIGVMSGPVTSSGITSSGMIDVPRPDSTVVDDIPDVLADDANKVNVKVKVSGGGLRQRRRHRQLLTSDRPVNVAEMTSLKWNCDGRGKPDVPDLMEVDEHATTSLPGQSRTSPEHQPWQEQGTVEHLQQDGINTGDTAGTEKTELRRAQLVRKDLMQPKYGASRTNDLHYQQQQQQERDVTISSVMMRQKRRTDDVTEHPAASRSVAAVFPYSLLAASTRSPVLLAGQSLLRNQRKPQQQTQLMLVTEHRLLPDDTNMELDDVYRTNDDGRGCLVTGCGVRKQPRVYERGSQGSASSTVDDPDVIAADSLTLPRIEEVLRSEGLQQSSITQQISKLRKKISRHVTRDIHNKSTAHSKHSKRLPVHLDDNLTTTSYSQDRTLDQLPTHSTPSHYHPVSDYSYHTGHELTPISYIENVNLVDQLPLQPPPTPLTPTPLDGRPPRLVLPSINSEHVEQSHLTSHDQYDQSPETVPQFPFRMVQVSAAGGLLFPPVTPGCRPSGDRNYPRTTGGLECSEMAPEACPGAAPGCLSAKSGNGVPGGGQLTLLVPDDSRQRSTLSSARSSVEVSSSTNLLSLAIKREEQTLNSYRDDIDKTKWLTSQHVEILKMGDGFVPPRILLVASNFPGIETLRQHIYSRPDILLHVYDFEKGTFEALLETIRNSLEAYRTECMLRSLLLICRGGIDHLFVFKKTVLTVQRLQKDQNSELVRFWKQVGELTSRINPDDAYVTFVTPDMLNKQTTLEDSDRNKQLALTNELQKLVHPNVVHFYVADVTTLEGRQHIDNYIDYDAYQQQQQQQQQLSANS